MDVDFALLADRAAVLTRWRGRMLHKDADYYVMRDKVINGIKDAERNVSANGFTADFKYKVCGVLADVLASFRTGKGAEAEKMVICRDAVTPMIKVSVSTVGRMYDKVGGYGVRNTMLHVLLSYCLGRHINWEELLPQYIEREYKRVREKVTAACLSEGARVCRACGRELPLSMFSENGTVCSTCKVISRSDIHMREKKWTPALMERVRMLYPMMGTKDIAKLLGVPMLSLKTQCAYAGLRKSPEYLHEVRSRASAIGKAKHEQNPCIEHKWTAEEDDYIVANYGVLTAKEMGEHLGVPASKVYWECRKLRKRLDEKKKNNN